jgi:protein-tyrosine phosphatase
LVIEHVALMKKILFVCTGNICRSPTAHAIARHKAKVLQQENRFHFDSAGIASYHVGEASDPRSVGLGEKNGISFSGIKARQIKQKDFENFDLIMAMDRSHLRALQGMATVEAQNKIQLFLEFCEVENPWNDEVIDPYYLKHRDFDLVFKITTKALDNLFEKLGD